MKKTGTILIVFLLLALSGYAMTPGRVMVSFTFDDGYHSVYAEAYPVLAGYNFPGVVYMVADNLDKEGRLSTAELHTMQDAGWEIGSHTVSHRRLPGLPAEELYEEVYTSKALLEEAGFTVTSFAPPGGANDETVTALVRRYYQTLRGTEAGVNTSAVDPYNLLVKPTFTWTSTRDVKRWVREARKQNAWLILVFHYIDESDPEYSMHPETFAEIAAMLHRREIPVVTIADGLRLLKDR